MNRQKSSKGSIPSDCVRALSKYVRISPSKARIVVGMIRGAKVADAAFFLEQSGTKSGRLILATLMSAIANAQTKLSALFNDLVVVQAFVDEGPRLKRARGRSRGGKIPILKRMSHLTVVVGKKAVSSP